MPGWTRQPEPGGKVSCSCCPFPLICGAMHLAIAWRWRLVMDKARQVTFHDSALALKPRAAARRVDLAG